MTDVSVYQATKDVVLYADGKPVPVYIGGMQGPAGASVVDGDKGDVVISVGASVYTVESATPSDGSFEVTGTLSTTGDATFGNNSADGETVTIRSGGLENGCVLVLDHNHSGQARIGQGSTGTGITASPGNGVASDIAFTGHTISFNTGAPGSGRRLTSTASYLTSALPVIVPDAAYWSSWDGDLSVPTKNAIYDKIESLAAGMGGTISDVPYGAAWDGITDVAPSKNVVYDQFLAVQNALATKADQSVFTSTVKGLAPASGGGSANFLRADGTWAAPPAGSGGGGSVSDAVYSPAWNGVADVAPSQNAVYDKIEALVLGGGGSLTDGDKGDVVISGSGSVLTVESATPGGGTFAVTGALTATGLATANQLKANNMVIDSPPGSLYRALYFMSDGVYAGAVSLSGDNVSMAYDCGVQHNFSIAGVVKLAVHATGATALAPLTVPDDPYAAGWDGSTQVPTKNAVYDKIAAVDAAVSGKANTSALASYLPLAGGTLSGNLAITKVDPVLYLVGAAGSGMTAISFNRDGGGGSSIQGYVNLAYHTDGIHTFYTDAILRASITDGGLNVTGAINLTSDLVSSGGVVMGTSLKTERPDGGCVYFGPAADNVYTYWNKTSLVLRAPSWLFVRSSDNGTMASIDGNGNFYGSGAVISGNISMTNASNATIFLGAGPAARLSGTPGQLTYRSNAHVWQRESDGVQLASLGSAGDLVLAGSTYARGDFIQGDTPTSWWQNANYRSFGIHVNSGYAYFMRGAVNGTAWTPLANGAWPMQLNLEDGQLVLGGLVQAKGNIYAQTDRRCYQQGSPGIGGGAEIFMATSAPSGGNDGDIWLQYV